MTLEPAFRDSPTRPAACRAMYWRNAPPMRRVRATLRQVAVACRPARRRRKPRFRLRTECGRLSRDTRGGRTPHRWSAARERHRPISKHRPKSHRSAAQAARRSATQHLMLAWRWQAIDRDRLWHPIAYQPLSAQLPPREATEARATARPEIRATPRRVCIDMAASVPSDEFEKRRSNQRIIVTSRLKCTILGGARGIMLQTVRTLI